MFSFNHLTMPSSQILIVGLLTLVWGCSRSPLSGSANYACGDGDRIISLDRLFCVYTSARRARPEMNAGEESTAGTEVIPVAGNDVIEPLCPEELPALYTYDTLYICAAEDSLQLAVIESVVAAWSGTYSLADMSSEVVRDQGVQDDGIGILRVRDMLITP